MSIAVELKDDVDATEIVLLSELAKRLHDGPAYSTLWRYYRYGVVSESGVTVKLETVRLTGGRGSSVEKYRTFVESLNS